MVDPLYTYFGSKRKQVSTIWRYLGDVNTYVEPFAGTAVCALNRPESVRNVYLNDYDCHIANVLRSITYRHDEMRQWVYHPRVELDMHMIHDYLINSKPSLRELLMTGIEACDPKLAGWWVWGCNNWVGGGWCSESCTTSGKDELSQARKSWSPVLGSAVGANKLNDRNQFTESTTWRQKPHHNNHLTESTTSRQKPNNHNKNTECGDLIDAVYQSLRPCRVLYGDFERVLTESYLEGICGILLDPPYAGTGIDDGLYGEADRDGDAYHRAYKWFVSNCYNPKYRIIFCTQESSLDGLTITDGVTKINWSRDGGYGQNEKKAERHTEVMLLSKACIKPQSKQYNLWEDL